jgi:HEAT repeat protein
VEQAVKNKPEQSRVRRHPAEALAHHHREKTHSPLLRGLADPNKEVRFWCAFALDQMTKKRAVPALKLLVVDDKGALKGFQSVRKERLMQSNASTRTPRTGARLAACFTFVVVSHVNIIALLTRPR